MDLNTLLTLTMAQITEFMEAERSTLFLYDEQRDELWSRVAQGEEVSEIRRRADLGIAGEVMRSGDVLNIPDVSEDPRFDHEQEEEVVWGAPNPSPHAGVSEIRLKANQGIAGAVMQTGESLNIPDAYQDPRFNKAIDAKTGYRTRNILCVPLADADGRRLGVIQVLNKRQGQGAFTPKDEKLLKTLGLQAAIAVENAQLYEHVNELRRSENELSEALRDQHRRLQAAYRQIEGTNEELKTTLKKFKMVRFTSFLFVLGLLVFTVFYFGTGKTLLQQMQTPSELVRSVRNVPDQKEQEFFTVTPAPVASTISLSGHVRPLEVLNIVSPMTGKVKARYFNYGVAVQKGDKLLSLDTAEEEVHYRNAKAELIRSRQRLHALEHWKNGSEVASARRALSRAHMEMQNLQRELKENQRLLKLGIIAASEHQASQQAYENQRLEYLAAQDELDSLLQQGGQTYLEIARLELENAERVLADAEMKLQQAEVYAPVSGVVMRPEEDKDKPAPPINVGSSVGLGEPLLAIGNMEGITVGTQVDEVDVRKLRVGQSALITGDAFPDHDLRGRIAKISSEADTKQGKVPYFTVSIVINQLGPEMRRYIRLGMSAQAAVTVYQKKDAFLVPFEALHRDYDGWQVTVRDRDTGYLRSIAVQTGVTTETGVEIIGGLGEGDEVLLH